MKLLFFLLSITFLFTNCRNKTGLKIKGQENTGANDSSLLRDNVKDSIKVSAHLIYDDGSLSTFDILNNKSLALWNVIIGEGDAVKPSKNTRIILEGDKNGLSVQIRNGAKMVVDTIINSLKKNVMFTISNTGCKIIYIKISNKRNNIIYDDSIPFHCGE